MIMSSRVPYPHIRLCAHRFEGHPRHYVCRDRSGIAGVGPTYEEAYNDWLCQWRYADNLAYP